MFRYLKRWWKYTTAKLTGRFDERADPKVQLEQAIREAHEQHRRLKEQAANVIAGQKQTEMRLNRAMEELEKVNNNARQAILMADEAGKTGDEAKMSEYTNAAEAFANRLVALEQEVEDLKQLHYQASQSSDQAKNAVKQNAQLLQKRLSEKQQLVGQLDQAKMQEQMSSAMASLSETVGEDVPTFEEVREKIEGRYAKAKGMNELTETSVESRMMEIENAAMNFEAKGRLEEIKSQLGLTPAAAEESTAPEAITETAAGATEPAPPVSQPEAAPTEGA